MKLAAEGLSLTLGETKLFKNLSLTLSAGEILGVRGANGSGKSSLCLCLCGLIEEDKPEVRFSGKIFYGGKPLNKMTVSERCRAVGIIFQNPDSQLFSPLVIEELAFAPENLALPREEIARRVDGALELCGITHLKGARTDKLSGGEKQLVAIASVLTMRPGVLIADEITSRVDEGKKNAVRQILKNYAAAGGAVIAVSHDLSDLAVADRVITIERGRDYGNKS